MWHGYVAKNGFSYREPPYEVESVKVWWQPVRWRDDPIGSFMEPGRLWEIEFEGGEKPRWWGRKHREEVILRGQAWHRQVYGEFRLERTRLLYACFQTYTSPSEMHLEWMLQWIDASEEWAQEHKREVDPTGVLGYFVASSLNATVWSDVRVFGVECTLDSDDNTWRSVQSVDMAVWSWIDLHIMCRQRFSYSFHAAARLMYDGLLPVRVDGQWHLVTGPVSKPEVVL